MNELFLGKYRPVTDTIGFLQCEVERASNAFLDWQEVIQVNRGVTLSASKLDGTFEESINSLLPLTSVERRRYLFVPTRSEWTAFLDNGHQGTDAFSHVSYLAEKLACNAVRETSIQDNDSGRYPANIIEIFGPKKTDFINRVRSVFSAFDGDRWVFSADGEVQPFEDTAQYANRMIKKRFTGEMLEAYLKYLGIAAFDESFYGPAGKPTILVEKTGPMAPAAREFGLPRG